jgi:hypothetical protein
MPRQDPVYDVIVAGGGPAATARRKVVDALTGETVAVGDAFTLNARYGETRILRLERP